MRMDECLEGEPKATPERLKNLVNKTDITILFIPQVIKMLVIVVLIFAICWFPWQAYMTLGLITPAINE